MKSTYNLSHIIKSDIVIALNKIVKESKEPLEGNCLYQNQSNFILHEDNKENLRMNLFNLAKEKNNIIEVGFNAGHSAAIYFLANPKVKLLAFDILYHSYTERCFNYLDQYFDIKLVKGDSTLTLKKYKSSHKFDIIHIDGGHDTKVLYKDIINCRRFSHKNSLLIVDDAYSNGIKNLIEKLIMIGCLREINYLKNGLYKTKYHRIFYYNSSKVKFFIMSKLLPFVNI